MEFPFSFRSIPRRCQGPARSLVWLADTCCGTVDCVGTSWRFLDPEIMDFMDLISGSSARTTPQLDKPLSKPTVWRCGLGLRVERLILPSIKEYVSVCPNYQAGYKYSLLHHFFKALHRLGKFLDQDSALSWQSHITPHPQFFLISTITISHSRDGANRIQPLLTCFAIGRTPTQISLHNDSDHAIPNHVYSGHRWHYGFDYPEGLQ